MRSTLITFILFTSIFNTGCSTYKPRDQGLSKVGYQEHKLEDGSYQLSYYGASHQSRETVEELWHQRASTLCANRSYDASPQQGDWTFDSYIILPPLLFKNESNAPSLSGQLSCR